MAGGLRELACHQIFRRWPLTSLEVLWRLQTPGTRVQGVPPSRTAPPPAPGGGKRTRGVYTEGILSWVWPGCCSKVFLWADLTQPGGEVHWSKPVRAKSKGYIPWSNATGLGGTGALGVAMPPERRTGLSYMRGCVVACPKRRDSSSGRGPPHGRQ